MLPAKVAGATLRFLWVSLSNAAQSCGTGYTSVRPILCQDHRHLRAALIHAPPRQLLADASKKSTHQLGKASAKNKDIRLEQINNVPSPNRQKVRGLSQHLGGKRVTLSIRFRYNLGIHGIEIAASQVKHSRFCSKGLRATRSGLMQSRKPFPCSPRDRWAGAQCLHTSALAATTLWSAIIDRHVPALGSAPRSPVINLPIKYDSGSNAGTEGCVKNVPISNSGAPDSLSQPCRVAVIVHSRGKSKNTLYFRGQWKIPPTRYVGRIEDHSSRRIERTRRANSNSCQV